MSSNVRLFIGSSSNNEDDRIENAYLNSLDKHSTTDIDITFMRQSNNTESYWSGWSTSLWSTPFSGFRWGIPEFLGFEGRAIYTDLDMINLRDITELYNYDLGGKPIAARKGKRFNGHEFCVMVIDCKKIQQHLIPVSRQKNNEEYHHRMIYNFSGNDDLVQELDPRWNCLDGEDLKIEDMYQIHYTDMATQPWRPKWYVGPQREHPRKDVVELFEKYEKLIHRSQEKNEDIVNYNIIGK